LRCKSTALRSAAKRCVSARLKLHSLSELAGP
jgi:hypothetical protein